MDVSDIRRLQMRLIIDQRFNGKQSAFAAAIERQPDYVSRCLKGTKRIGEEFAGHVERQLGLPDGWMSGVHGVDSLASSRLPARCRHPRGREQRPLRQSVCFHAAILDHPPQPASAGFLLFINFDESGFHGASENVYLGVLTE